MPLSWNPVELAGGWNSRNGYEELDHRSLYVRKIPIIIGKAMWITADEIPISSFHRETNSEPEFGMESACWLSTGV